MENQNEKNGQKAHNPQRNLNSESVSKDISEENKNSSDKWPEDATLEEYLEKDKDGNNKMKPGSLNRK